MQTFTESAEHFNVLVFATTNESAEHLNQSSYEPQTQYQGGKLRVERHNFVDKEMRNLLLTRGLELRIMSHVRRKALIGDCMLR